MNILELTQRLSEIAATQARSCETNVSDITVQTNGSRMIVITTTKRDDLEYALEDARESNALLRSEIKDLDVELAIADQAICEMRAKVAALKGGAV